MIFELDTHLGELIADAIRQDEVLSRTSFCPVFNERFHLGNVDESTTGTDFFMGTAAICKKTQERA